MLCKENDNNQCEYDISGMSYQCMFLEWNPENGKTKCKLGRKIKLKAEGKYKLFKRDD